MSLSPATGTLAGILYKDGDVVPVTKVIAYVLKEGETIADLPKLDEASVPSKPQPVTATMNMVSASLSRDCHTCGSSNGKRGRR